MTHHLRKDESVAPKGASSPEWEDATDVQERRSGGGHVFAALGIVAAIGIVIGLVILHLTGVLGPGAH
jgi:hypothetical protein